MNSAFILINLLISRECHSGLIGQGGPGGPGGSGGQGGQGGQGGVRMVSVVGVVRSLGVNFVANFCQNMAL